MLVLLPPSEAKTRPSTGPCVDLDALSLPELNDHRARMLRAVARTAASPRAMELLGVPASTPELVERMRLLEEEPTAPALSVYSGVLFDAMGVPERIGSSRVLIQSALFGLVDASDRIPAYRLSAGSTLSRLGVAGRWWAPHLRTAARDLLQETADSPSPLVLDCRSGAYRSMMPLAAPDGVNVLEVGAVQEREGRRTVVSHDAKRYRGWVARALLDAVDAPRTPADAADVLRAGFSRGLDVELDGSTLTIVDRLDQE